MDEIILIMCVCVCVLLTVCVYLGMLACVCVFMHMSLHSCHILGNSIDMYCLCCRTSLWQWKTLWYQANCSVRLLHQSSKKRFPLSQTFTSSLWIWLLNANKLLLEVWTHYKQLSLSPLMKRTTKQKVLTTNRGGVITPGPNFRGYAQSFFKWRHFSVDLGWATDGARRSPETGWIGKRGRRRKREEGEGDTRAQGQKRQAN